MDRSSHITHYTIIDFVEINMFVCRPEYPILTDVVDKVNSMYIQVCKQTY